MNVTAVNGARVIDANTTASLLSQVLWITTVGFGFTAFGAYIAPASLGVGYMFLILVNFGLIFAISAAARKSTGLGLALFYLFTTFMGVEISPILNSYLHSAGGQTVVLEAAVTTGLGMALMAVVAEFARFNYVKASRVAMFALIGLIVVGFLGAFVHIVHPGMYAWLSLIVFSALLLFDFMRLKDRGAAYGPVQMSLSIYLDALNIFIALLQIFGGGSRSRD